MFNLGLVKLIPPRLKFPVRAGNIGSGALSVLMLDLGLKEII